MILRLFPTHEKKWIQRAREGDINALGRLYEMYFEPLYNFIFYRVGKNREIAEDITQYVFLTMVKNINGFSESKGSLHNWLCGIARHRIVDAFRFQQKHVPLGDSSADNDAEIDVTISQMEQQLLPDEMLANKELQSCVAGILTRLPGHYRQALSAKYIEDLDVSAIAQKMGLSEKAIESLLTRARNVFRKELKGVENAKRLF